MIKFMLQVGRAQSPSPFFFFLLSCYCLVWPSTQQTINHFSHNGSHLTCRCITAVAQNVTPKYIWQVLNIYETWTKCFKALKELCFTAAFPLHLKKWYFQCFQSNQSLLFNMRLHFLFSPFCHTFNYLCVRFSLFTGLIVFLPGWIEAAPHFKNVFNTDGAEESELLPCLKRLLGKSSTAGGKRFTVLLELSVYLLL